MFLSDELVKSISFGCINVTREDDGMHFYRHTKKQTDAFFRLSDFLGNGSLATTGVVLDFCTNSKTLSFEVSKGNKFEVLLNGLNFYQVLFDETLSEKKSLKLNINPKREKVRITVAFPSHDAGVLKSIELDDDSFVSPYEYSGKMLFIGDSITQGWNAKYDTLSYAYRVARFFDCEMLNQGVGGAFYHKDTFDEFDFEPDTVFLAYGTNDFNYYSSLSDFRENMNVHMRKVKERYGDKKIYVITPIWMAESGLRKMGTFDECRNEAACAAESFGFYVIDGFSLFPHLSEFLEDRALHPHDLGFSIYSENLIKEILKRENKL